MTSDVLSTVTRLAPFSLLLLDSGLQVWGGIISEYATPYCFVSQISLCYCVDPKGLGR